MSPSTRRRRRRRRAGRSPGLLIAHVGPAEPIDEGAADLPHAPALPRAGRAARRRGRQRIDRCRRRCSIRACCSNADVLVIRDVADPDLLPIVAARRRQRKLSVYEITQPPVRGAARRRAHRRAARTWSQRSLRPLLARQADCLQLSTPALDAHCAALNPRRAVFPNQLWDAPPPTPARRPGSRRDRLGGIARAPRGPARRDPGAGRHPRTAPGGRARGDDRRDACGRCWTCCRRGACRSRPGARSRATTASSRASTSASRRCAPTAYNRCLGDTRFIEYAAHGVLAVCADLEPYRDVVRPGETGYLFADAAELETVLERALAEGEVRAAIPARAARYAASERIERRHAARPPRVLPVGRRADGIRDQGPRTRRRFRRPSCATNATPP